MVTTSWMVAEAFKAAEIIQRHGIDAEIVDVLLLESVKKTKNVVIMDYDWSYIGFVAELSAMINENIFGQLQRPVKRFGFEHVPCPTTRPLENEFYHSAPKVIREVEKMFGKSPLDLSKEVFYDYERKFKGAF